MSPAATIAPLPADVDAWAATQPGFAAYLAGAAQQPGITVSAVVVGWTRADLTQHFAQIPDPAVSSEAANFLRGLLAAYGAILVRVYQFTFTQPTPASVAAAAAVQAAANNPAAWAIS
jgi:hypothetical protein